MLRGAVVSGALPVYRRVVRERPHGDGASAMLERLPPRWPGKIFVLILLGFAATDFVITSRVVPQMPPRIAYARRG